MQTRFGSLFGLFGTAQLHTVLLLGMLVLAIFKPERIGSWPAFRLSVILFVVAVALPASVTLFSRSQEWRSRGAVDPADRSRWDGPFHCRFRLLPAILFFANHGPRWALDAQQGGSRGRPPRGCFMKSARHGSVAASEPQRSAWRE